jgi:hypothetical protein
MRLMTLILGSYALFSHMSLAGGCCGTAREITVWRTLVIPTQPNLVRLEARGEVSDNLHRIFEGTALQDRFRFRLTFDSISSRSAFENFISELGIATRIVNWEERDAIEIYSSFELAQHVFNRIRNWVPSMPAISLPAPLPVLANETERIAVVGTPLNPPRPQVEPPPPVGYLPPTRIFSAEF